MSDEEEDETVKFGTPLEPYDEDEVPKKKSSYQDITEQFAYDSNGKRRFHGAFTGGFSAGYWNTVGTPEGFTPTAFKSSREQRAETSLFSKPEDFMDEEDRSEFGIAPRSVQTTTDFSSTKRKKPDFREGPIPGDPVLQVFLQPAHETVSVKILKKMGWKPGKGVGEKVTRKEKKAAKKVYGCYIPAEFRKNNDNEEADNESEDDDEDEYSTLLFEPDDIEPYLARPKCDTFGIGYSGLSRHSVLGGLKDRPPDDIKGKSHLLTVDKGRNVSIRGQAFGVGAFEEDDDDIYAKDDMSSYDYSLDEPGKRKEKKKAETKTYKNVLSGFVPSTTVIQPTKSHLPPSLPRGYVPRNPTVRKTRFSAPIEMVEEKTQPRDRTLGRHELTADRRGEILGEDRPKEEEKPKEEPEKPKPKSYEDRIAAITGRNINFSSNTKTIILGEEEKKEENIVDESTGTFRPFTANPEKQQRYEEFVKSKQDGEEYKDTREASSGDKVLEWEVTREKAEFEQAYKLYKPLTGLMNERFTTATKADGGILDKVLSSDGLHYVSAEKAEAARTGMYGKLTRETNPWKPESLLCKRFNVPDPFNSGRGGQTEESKKKSYSIFEYLESSVYNKESYKKDQEKSKMPRKEIEEDNTSKNEIVKSVPKPVKPIIESIPIINKSSEIIPTVSKSSENHSAKRAEPPKPLFTSTKRLTVAELFLQEKQKENEERRKAAQTTSLAFSKELDDKKEDEEVKQTIDNFNKIDLYKAIFLSDSESDTEKEETEKPPSKENREAPSIALEDAAEKNVERNPSPPRGIFANLNFDRLNAWQNKTKPEEKPKPPPPVQAVDAYGPKLPDKPIPKLPKDDVMEVDDSSSSSSDSWVEVDKVKKHKKEKKSHKKKKKSKKSHKHHKSKHRNR